MINLKLLRSYAAPGPAAICGRPNKRGTQNKSPELFRGSGLRGVATLTDGIKPSSSFRRKSSARSPRMCPTRLRAPAAAPV